MIRWMTSIGLSFAVFAGGAVCAQNNRVTIGLYLPDLPGMDRAQRLRAVQSLASYLSDTTGLAVNGRTFSRGADLVSRGKKGGVDYAIAPAAFLAALQWTPVAALVQGNAKAAPWVIVAGSEVKTVGELQGRKVALPRVLERAARGFTDQGFVTKVLLEGEVDMQYFKWVFSPDAPSAIEAVRLGKTSAAIVGSGGGVGDLGVIFSSRPVPLHALVVTNSAVADKTTQAIKRALLAWQGRWLIFSGWVEANRNRFAGLRSQMGARTAGKKPPVFRPPPHTLASREVTRAHIVDITLPPPLGVVRAPVDKPDQSI